LKKHYQFTSESVTEGHPDKIADQISDAILDAIYTEDPRGRVACETLVTTGLAVVAGEITTSTYVEIPQIIRQTIREAGYTRAKYGFDCDTCGVITSIDPQSPDIAVGVNHALEDRTGEVEDGELDKLGAGDQGMVFGYACRETPELMPLPIMLAHKLAHRLAEVRKAKILPYLRPDGKTQVTVDYVNGKPLKVSTVLISAQHRPGIGVDQIIKPDLIDHVIKPVILEELIDYKNVRVLVNPTGKFEVGGPMGDTGVTGRKTIVDTYGGMARHGGGCFSGKDPTKVDRSGAYAARYVAKNVVAAGLADKCEVQIAYAIGVAHPVSLMVDTFGTAKIDPKHIEELIMGHFDLRPAAIIRDLDLRRPIYKKTACYGHFGRTDKDFTWERMDRADVLRKEAGCKSHKTSRRT
jgi:S-adenosylmethionine synthetase